VFLDRDSINYYMEDTSYLMNVVGYPVPVCAST